MLITLAIIAAAVCGWLIGAVTVARRAYRKGADAAFAEAVAIAQAVIDKRDAARAEAHAAGD